MTEATNGQPAMGNMPPAGNHEILRQRTLDAVEAINPDLLRQPGPRHLIEMGAQAIIEVAERHGTPDHPLYDTGTVEKARPMTYHNSGEDGHSSAGEQGMGVPRATLLIAREVNHAAGYEVYDSLSQAINFNAAANHDLIQNCGRALQPEGQQGEGYGDERMSAEIARDRLRSSSSEAGVQIDPDTPQRVYDGVMATAFIPATATEKSRQNVDYRDFDAEHPDPVVLRRVLDQEATACADLLNLAHRRGPVGSVENIIEVLASNANGRVLQRVLEARGISTTGEADIRQILDVIGQDTTPLSEDANDTLLARFTALMDGQSKFFSGLEFSDRAIRTVTGGRGIRDGLFSGSEEFPGCAENAALLAGFTEALRNGTNTPRKIWEQARIRAGYQDL